MPENKDELYDLIESWLDGDLSKEAADNFSKRLKNEPDLRELTEQHFRVRKAFEQVGEQQNKEFVKNITDRIAVKKKKRQMKMALLFGAFLLIAGLGYFFFKPVEIDAPDSPQIEESPSKVAAEDAETKKKEPIEENEEKKEEVVENRSIEQPKKVEEQPKKSPAQKQPLPSYDEIIALQVDGMKSYEEEFVQNLPMRSAQSNQRLSNGKESFLAQDFSAARDTLQKTTKEDGQDYPRALALLSFVEFREQNYAAAAERFLEYKQYKKNNDLVDWMLLHFLYNDYENHKEKFWNHLNSTILSKEFEHKYKTDGEALKKELIEKGVSEVN